MVESPSTQIPNGGTLNPAPTDGEAMSPARGGGGGVIGPPSAAATRGGYEARQKELDQLLEGMLCTVQDIPDLKSQFCSTSVDIDSIPSELNRVCPPSPSPSPSTDARNNPARLLADSRHYGVPQDFASSPSSSSYSTAKSRACMNGNGGGFHTPGRHHSMRDEYLRSRVPQRPRAKPAPNVDPEWASLLMREFEPARRHNERTRAHSESRGPFIPDISFEDFNFSDFDSPPISHSPARRNNQLGDYGWDRQSTSTSGSRHHQQQQQQQPRKDSLDSQDRSVSEFASRRGSYEGKPGGSNRHQQDVIDCRDLDELSEEFAAEFTSQLTPPVQQQRYAQQQPSERKMYDPADMWEPSPAQSMTWLQKQQQKLRERREARYRSERSPQEIRLISELKGVQSRMKVTQPASNGGAAAVEDPPTRASPGRQVTQPLAIRVNFTEEAGKRGSPAKSLAEDVPDKPVTVSRNPSQDSYDRQRSYDSSKSLDDNDSLEQVILQAQQEVAARSLRGESVERTSTPNFPVCPGTPYLNSHTESNQQQHHQNASYSPSSSSGFSAATAGPLSSNDSGFSGGNQGPAEKLPPKSPPSSRRLKWGLQLARNDSGKKKKPASAYGSGSEISATSSGLLTEIQVGQQGSGEASTPPPPPPLPPPPPVTPPGDINDSLRNLLRPAYLRSLSSEDDEEAGAHKLNESRDSSLDTSKSSSELGRTNGQAGPAPNSAVFDNKDASPAAAGNAASGMSNFTQRLRPGDIEPVGPRNPVTFVRDLSSFWYKPTISREDAIQVLRDQEPGTFLVRDSTSFPGAFGLALKVAATGSIPAKKNDTSAESVRHFLIETTTSGVRIKGCQNEPVFGSLSALVYQHSVTALALPCKLVLPSCDPTENKLADGADASAMASQKLLRQGAACNVIYLHSIDVESLTGPQAVRKTVYTYLSRCDSGVLHPPLSAHFKVSTQGITITDNERLLFFRRHYPMDSVSYCGLDPEDRKWKPDLKAPKNLVMLSPRPYFGFVARKPGTLADNQCHIFAQLEPEQPASAIINFVSKVMQAYSSEQGRPRFL